MAPTNWRFFPGSVVGRRSFAHEGAAGGAAAESEWQLIAGTHNLLKLYRRALGDTTIAPFSHLAIAPTG